MSIWTTSRESHAKKGRTWLSFMADRELERDRHYVFTDGSSLGGYAAVLMSPLRSGEHMTDVESDWKAPTKTRNVGAEWNGLLLGLDATPPACHLVVVTDYLWSLAQLIGVRRTLEPETVEQLTRAHALIEKRQFASLTLVHHEGHQSTPDAFTKWNKLADEECAGQNRSAKAKGWT